MDGSAGIGTEPLDHVVRRLGIRRAFLDLFPRDDVTLVLLLDRFLGQERLRQRQREQRQEHSRSLHGGSLTWVDCP